ncbi:hypothetical protein N7481_001859 [Penicillium waksmanii]|uniref:uncharacterized protein n=1 Tax=Penicillium waksmanii TaxID=69791 RepID=UPI002547C9A5|nr:uncharacterized protein N7481_001859 [Penicillium waksmanii]KAJ5994882.1 hypothetical protein N7481_001859 [Penicillium waksmanii]
MMNNTARTISSLRSFDNAHLDMQSFDIRPGSPESVCRQLLLNPGIPNFADGPIVEQNTPTQGVGQLHPGSFHLRIMIYRMGDHHTIKETLKRAFFVEELNSIPRFIESLKNRSDGGRLPGATISYRLKQKAFFENDSKFTAKANATTINIQVTNFVDDVWARFDSNAEHLEASRNSDREVSFQHLDSVLESLAINSYELRKHESRKQDKRNRVFRSPDDAAWYFKKYLRSKKLDYNTAGPSTELLISFFQSRNINSQATLENFLGHFFEDHFFKDTGRENYSAVARDYEGIDFDLGFYLVDYTIFGRNNATFDCTNIETITPTEKLRTVMSAFLWMRLLYPRREWQSRLLKFPFEKELKDHFHWLVDIKQQESLKEDHELTGGDQTRIDRLWRWLSRHDQRPIKLAFLVANNRMARDVLNEMDVVHRFIEEITDSAQLGRRTY